MNKNESVNVDKNTILQNRTTLTAREFGKLNDLSELTVRRHCYSGLIKSIKIGRALRIPVSELQRLQA